MSFLQTVLQTAPNHTVRMMGYGGGSFISTAILAISALIISVGVFYVLVKLGSFLDAMKESVASASVKK